MFRRAFCLTIVIAALGLAGCASHSVHGTYVFDAEHMRANFSGSGERGEGAMPTQGGNLGANMVEQMIRELGDLRLELKEDGTWTYEDREDHETGTYTVEGNRVTLKSDNKESSNTMFGTLIFDPSKGTLESEVDDGLGMRFIQEKAKK